MITGNSRKAIVWLKPVEKECKEILHKRKGKERQMPYIGVDSLCE